MPSAWEWWAGIVGDDCYELAGGCSTRERAITEALRNAGDEDVIQIVEAQSSSAMKYEGADFVPFVRTRNQEVLGRGAALRATPRAEGLGDA